MTQALSCSHIDKLIFWEWDAGRFDGGARGVGKCCGGAHSPGSAKSSLDGYDAWQLGLALTLGGWASPLESHPQVCSRVQMCTLSRMW